MNSFELPFAKINILQDDIAEVIAHADIEVNLLMVNELHRFLISKLKSPFSVLVNRSNQYTYDFEAQLKIGDIEQMHAVAAVTYSKASTVVAKGMVNMPRSTTRITQFFSVRDDALKWLIDEQNKL